MWRTQQEFRTKMPGRLARGMASLAAGALLLSASVACKEPPKPKKKETPATSFSPTASFTPITPQETVDPKCNQPSLFVCKIQSSFPELVQLCLKIETANPAPCSEDIWSKELYDRISTAQAEGFDGSMITCPATTYYVSTQVDPLNIRNKPNMAGDILDVAPRGSTVQCLGVVDTWIKAKTSGGLEGYMSNAYLSTNPPGPSSYSGGGGGSYSGASTKGTIRCARWVRLEAKETFVAAPFTKCSDRESQDGRYIWGQERRFENCYKIGNSGPLHSCECEAQYKREIADKPISECVGEWKPYN